MLLKYKLTHVPVNTTTYSLYFIILINYLIVQLKDCIAYAFIGMVRSIYFLAGLRDENVFRNDQYHIYKSVSLPIYSDNTIKTLHTRATNYTPSRNQTHLCNAFQRA
ncbi:MAG: hypothetical protein EX263_13655 [Flavobacteriaceae bacterium]|nr:MAG: hypothetical protein EX263_13655 [Flavobacteriaceae bacterium]